MKHGPAFPLPKIEPGEPPPMARGRKKEDRWSKFARVLEDVRALGGRSAKICHHPSGREVVHTLKRLHPEFVFVTRAFEVAGKTVYGVWARLNVEVPANPVPDLPPVNPLQDPV